MTNLNPLNKGIPFQQKPKGKKNSTPIISEEEKKKIQDGLKRNVVFSWKYFDKDHKVYNCGGIEMPWIISLVETFKNISSLELKDLRSVEGQRRGLRFHQIRWGKVQEEKFNFNEDFFEQIRDNCYQLSLSTAKGRFHGFLIDNIFFIVWLDPHHQLELMKDHGGVKTFDFPKNENDILRDRIEFLEQELETATSLLEEAAQ
ncbi:hypothetical protein [Bacillus safensis]|uniref:hypothetical protein n=1 Tax=Bacillus safensis TaxID=561879 RepID=UPI000DAE5495|nr:hypothetical protein [Bacillus safensis]